MAFQVKCVEFSHCDIAKSANAMNTKFETQLFVNKQTLWVVQNYKILIQDSGGRHFEFGLSIITSSLLRICT